MSSWGTCWGSTRVVPRWDRKGPVNLIRGFNLCGLMMIVSTYILSHQRKTAEAGEAEIGHFKDSSCSNQRGTCDIDDAMMLPSWVTDYDGWSSTTHGFPPCWIPTRISLNMGSWFMRFYSILFHWMVCSDQDDTQNPIFNIKQVRAHADAHWKEVTNIPLERELKGGDLCVILYTVGGTLPYWGIAYHPLKMRFSYIFHP